MKPTKQQIRAVEDKASDDIARYGRTIIGVFPPPTSQDAVNDSFVYSVGNFLKGLPELLIIGTFQAGAMVNVLSQQMVDQGRRFTDGEMVEFGSGRVCLIEASDNVKKLYTIQATNMLGRSDYEVMQVVLTDREGRFPWDAQCADPFWRVKVHRKRVLQ